MNIAQSGCPHCVFSVCGCGCVGVGVGVGVCVCVSACVYVLSWTCLVLSRLALPRLVGSSSQILFDESRNPQTRKERK